VEVRTKPGIRSKTRFKKLAQGMPEQGETSLVMFSGKFARRRCSQIQAKAMANKQTRTPTSRFQKFDEHEQTERLFLQCSLNEDGKADDRGQREPGSEQGGDGAGAVVGALTAIANSPNFVKARATANAARAATNLRQIDAAKHQWAAEEGKNDRRYFPPGMI